MKIKLLYLFTSVFLLFCSCKKNDIKSPASTDLAPPVLSSAVSPINATIQGNVFDENNKPVAGVSINVGAKTALTDLSGYFRIDNASLDKNASLLSGQMKGYFKIVKTFAATSGVNYIRIKMVKKNLAGTIIASSGGTVNLTDGSSVTLPANAVIKKSDKSSYSGTINVYAVPLDPTSQDISSTMPGNLMGDDSSGKRVGLQSFGILAVELESSNAEPLQILSGKSAILSFKIPSALQGTAPSSIALWYINDTTGLWQQQGRANKSGSSYIGAVSHFSFWDTDIPVNSVMLDMTVTDINNNPLQFVTVELISAVYGISYGYTDSLGQVSGLVPFNEQLNFSISSNLSCGNNFGQNLIGPFTKSSSVTLTGANFPTTTVSGTVTGCDTNAITSGYVLIYHNLVRFSTPIDYKGNFTIRLVRCGPGDSISVIGINTSANQESIPAYYALNSPSQNIGVISACGQSADVYTNVIYDDTVYSLIDSANTFGVSSSDGTSDISFECYNYKTQIRAIYFEIPYSLTPGTFPLTSVTFNINGVSMSGQPPINIMANLTECPASIGQFYAGNFSGNFTELNGTIHSISCSFRVRRNHI